MFFLNLHKKGSSTAKNLSYGSIWLVKNSSVQSDQDPKWPPYILSTHLTLWINFSTIMRIPGYTVWNKHPKDKDKGTNLIKL